MSAASRAAQFSKTAPALGGGTPRVSASRLEGDQQVYRRDGRLARCAAAARGRRQCSSAARAGSPSAAASRTEAALADLEHLAVELRGRQVERRRRRPPRRRACTPPCSISRRASLELIPKCVGDQRRQVDRAVVGPARLDDRSAIVLGHLAAHVDAGRSAPRPPRPPPSPWKRSTSRRASSRLASPGWRAGSSSLAEQQPVVLAHRLVGDAHQLPEHLLRRVGDADVVAERLAHLAARRRSRAGSASSGSTAAAAP